MLVRSFFGVSFKPLDPLKASEELICFLLFRLRELNLKSICLVQGGMFWSGYGCGAYELYEN